MNKRRTVPESDIRLSAIDLLDNLAPELDRLHALAELLSSVQDEIDQRVALGLALLLKDIEGRARCILQAFDRTRTREQQS